MCKGDNAYGYRDVMLQSLAHVQETISLEITYHPDSTSVIVGFVYTNIGDDDDHRSRSRQYACFEIAKPSQEF